MANYQSQYTGEQIDAAVQQAQRVPTLEQNIVNGDAESIMRMQGRSNQGVHDNTMDPLYYKLFTGGAQADLDVKKWLDSLHSTEQGVVPLGLLRLHVNGYFIYVLQNILNYANDEYTQTILNGDVRSNGGIGPGMGIYTRSCQMVNGVTTWTAWKRFLTTDDL